MVYLKKKKTHPKLSDEVSDFRLKLSSLAGLCGFVLCTEAECAHSHLYELKLSGWVMNSCLGKKISYQRACRCLEVSASEHNYILVRSGKASERNPTLNILCPFPCRDLSCNKEVILYSSGTGLMLRH